MSISKPIKISYKWDRDNFEKAFENSYTYQYKNSARRYIGWFFVALAQFGVVAALKKGSFALLMFSSLLLFYWYIAKKWLVHKRAVKVYENSPLKDSNIELEITDEGVKQGDIVVDWDDIQGVIPVEDDILLYQGQKPFYIPLVAFNSLEEKNALKSLAKEKGKLFDV